MTNHPRDLNQLMEVLTRNGSDNPATNHALVACTEVIVRNLAAIHEQLRIANLIALAAIDPDRGGPSEELASVAWQACGEISICRGYEVRDHDGTPDRIEIRSLLPDIAAALGIPQEDQ